MKYKNEAWLPVEERANDPFSQAPVIAAFATCGFAWRAQATLPNSGESSFSWSLRAQSSAIRTQTSGVLMHLLKTGKLAKQDPGHPLLVCWHALQNMQMLRRDGKCNIVATGGGLARLVPEGAGFAEKCLSLMPEDGNRVVIPVRHAALTAALVTMGFAPVWPRTGEGGVVLRHASLTQPFTIGQAAPAAEAISRQHEAAAKFTGVTGMEPPPLESPLPSEHPFHFAYSACLNLPHVLAARKDAMEKHPTLLLKSPREASRRAALIGQDAYDASGRARTMIRDHLLGRR